MAARTKSKVTPKYKTKYRVKNWPAYEAALRKRGDVTLWFDEEAIDAWNAPATGRPGGQPRYSDLAIVTALTWRALFRLPLRLTETCSGHGRCVPDGELATCQCDPGYRPVGPTCVSGLFRRGLRRARRLHRSGQRAGLCVR